MTTKPTNPAERMREAFETTYRAKTIEQPYWVKHEKRYFDRPHQDAWEIWQAATRHALDDALAVFTEIDDQHSYAYNCIKDLRDGNN